jgi:hypothetical protein
MNNGWIKLHRSFLDWEWYNCPNTARLFLHCLLKANHKDKKWQGQIIKRGTFITSLSTLANETGLTIQKVRTSLQNLQVTGEVTRKSTSKLTQLTICKYDTYQEFELSNNTPDNNQITNEQQSNNKRITTTNNDKNIKKVRIDPDSFCPSYVHLELWKAFMEVRKAKKAAQTERALKVLVSQLDKLEQECPGWPNEELNACVVNSWKGIFPDEKRKPKKRNWY